MSQTYIKRNVYMDDLYVATDSMKKAQRILREMRATLSRGGFNLTKWNSNSSEFLENVEPGIRLDPSKVHPQNQKVLGLPWHPITDCYTIEYSDQSIAVRFVIGKARVAPLKKMTISNLELQAAVYGAQFA